MRFELVDRLRQAMQVRSLRNACRLDLTNSRNHIGVFRQLQWYFQNYQSDKKTASYRLYLLYDEQNSPVGYGALALREEELFLTECVAPAYRGRGYGFVILQRLIEIASAERRCLMADIWATNTPSLALHKKAGFELVSRATKDGRELQRHILSLTQSEEK
jgi:RimJ/RimL family protein N-acetyltransferase